MSKKKASPAEISTKLLRCALKLRGISHLIESQGEPMAVPLDIRDVNYGISLVLDEIAKVVRKSSAIVELEFERKKTLEKA